MRTSQDLRQRPTAERPDRHKRVSRRLAGELSRRADDARRQYFAGGETTLPNVVIIGAQRSGTTSVHRALSQHPDVVAPRRKEIHYATTQYWRGETWYRSFFPVSERSFDRRIRIEATPYYLYHPAAPERLAALLPAARFIAILREPVERALSQYRHEFGAGFETHDLATAIAIEETRAMPPPDDDIVQGLREEFEEPNRDLRALTGVHWDDLRVAPAGTTMAPGR